MDAPDHNAIFDDTPVQLAYLFGSRAQERARPTSDYDIGVLFPRDVPAHERGAWHLELIGRLIDAYHRDHIDLVVLNDAPPLLRFEVIRPRHVLYNRDDEARVAFEFRTMQEWYDWEPRYTRMQRAWLANVAKRIEERR